MRSSYFVGSYSTFQAFYISSLNNNNVFYSSFFSRSPSAVGLSQHRFLSKLGLFPVTFSVFCFHSSFDPTRHLLSNRVVIFYGYMYPSRPFFPLPTSSTHRREKTFIDFRQLSELSLSIWCENIDVKFPRIPTRRSDSRICLKRVIRK